MFSIYGNFLRRRKIKTFRREASCFKNNESRFINTWWRNLLRRVTAPRFHFQQAGDLLVSREYIKTEYIKIFSCLPVSLALFPLKALVIDDVRLYAFKTLQANNSGLQNACGQESDKVCACKWNFHRHYTNKTFNGCHRNSRHCGFSPKVCVYSVWTMLISSTHFEKASCLISTPTAPYIPFARLQRRNFFSPAA